MITLQSTRTKNPEIAVQIEEVHLGESPKQLFCRKG